MFQSVLVAPVQVSVVSSNVTVACVPPTSGSSVVTLMAPALAVTVPCVEACRAVSTVVFTVAEYLIVIDLPPAWNVGIVLRVTFSPAVGAFGSCQKAFLRTA